MKNLFSAALSIAIFASLHFCGSAHAADILFIGDSHTYGCFGETLDKSLRETTDPRTNSKLSVRSTGTCGSSAASWLEESGHQTACGFRACGADGVCDRKKKIGRSESLSSQLKNEAPRITVVALGTNMLKSKGAGAMNDVSMLIQQIQDAGSECIWVGPPQPAVFFQPIKSYERFNESLKLTVEAKGCRFISSNEKTARENLKDKLGLHYDCPNATTWAGKVATELTPVLSTFLARSPNTRAKTEGQKTTRK